jgi:hypothetical protein
MKRKLFYRMKTLPLEEIKQRLRIPHQFVIRHKLKAVRVLYFAAMGGVVKI